MISDIYQLFLNHLSSETKEKAECILEDGALSIEKRLESLAGCLEPRELKICQKLMKIEEEIKNLDKPEEDKKDPLDLLKEEMEAQRLKNEEALSQMMEKLESNERLINDLVENIERHDRLLNEQGNNFQWERGINDSLRKEIADKDKQLEEEKQRNSELKKKLKERKKYCQAVALALESPDKAGDLIQSLRERPLAAEMEETLPEDRTMAETSNSVITEGLQDQPTSDLG